MKLIMESWKKYLIEIERLQKHQQRDVRSAMTAAILSYFPPIDLNSMRDQDYGDFPPPHILHYHLTKEGFTPEQLDAPDEASGGTVFEAILKQLERRDWIRKGGWNRNKGGYFLSHAGASALEKFKAGEGMWAKVDSEEDYLGF